MEHKRRLFEKHLSIFVYTVKVIGIQISIGYQYSFSSAYQHSSLFSFMFHKRKQVIQV